MSRLALSGPALAVRTCLGRLAGLGMIAGEPRPHLPRGGSWASAGVDLAIPGPADLECALSWWGPMDPGGDRPGSEAAVQAATGLMHLHGREAGRPRRLGIEVASVAAGALGALGVVAAVLAHHRGRGPARVETSVAQAGLLAIQQYLARASCADTARAGEADVFLHNWRPGKAAEWAMAAEELAWLGQGLVHAPPRAGPAWPRPARPSPWTTWPRPEPGWARA